MPSGFEVPGYEDLVAEQALVQAGKFQGRTLSEYEYRMFPGEKWLVPRSSPTSDFVRPLVGDAKRITLKGVLEGLGRLRADDTIEWYDMGGGRALAMRQLRADPVMRERFSMTNVDLFDYGLNNLLSEELEYLEKLAPGMTDPVTEPTLLRANAETVVLPKPAGFITCLETMQYLNNPLAAIANWYNQLDDDGLLIVAAEHDWASWIRYNRHSEIREDEVPMKHFLEVLTQAGIQHAATSQSDWDGGFRPVQYPEEVKILTVQKKPQTAIEVNRSLTEIWVNSQNYKAAYYETSTENRLPLIQVVDVNEMATHASAPLATGYK